ncbi:hypothetical protein CF394_00755 [Tetzosporium hominis]|uniref:Uncharacterized protein n=1 Tax=Tetzosporium hominis TaxID=2020506 RepID=A0A264W8X0_9BACL|nr:hypothetical protein [Tetzosporium hominis]OZS79467.1 hypothetical protein CF394_00755 [Tetzosporium hominis]
MKQKLVVNHGEFEFTNFNKAVVTLEEEYGYEGLAWDMVVASGDLDILCDFLSDDGIESELVCA